MGNDPFFSQNFPGLIYRGGIHIPVRNRNLKDPLPVKGNRYTLLRIYSGFFLIEQKGQRKYLGMKNLIVFQMMEKGLGNSPRVRIHKNSDPFYPMDLPCGKIVCESIQSNLKLREILPEQTPTPSPGIHTNKQQACEKNRKPSPRKKLRKVGNKIRKIYKEKKREKERKEEIPFPDKKEKRK
jgi:hypothetical protein